MPAKADFAGWKVVPFDLGKRAVVGGLVLGKLCLQGISLRLRGGDLAVVTGGGGGYFADGVLQRRALFGKRGLDLGAALGVRRGRERGKFGLGGGDLSIHGGYLSVQFAKRRVALVLQGGKVALGLRELPGEGVVFAL